MNAKRDIEDKVRASRADAIYIAASDEIKKYEVDTEGISRALANGYHFVGNGYSRNRDDAISKHISFSQCVDLCTKKRHDAGESWNSFYWDGRDNECVCSKGERGHNPHTSFVHFRI